MNICNPQTSLGFTPDLYPQGTHICYLYNDEEERKRIVSAYLRSGLEQHESVGYFPDVLSPDMLEHALNQLGMAAPAPGQLNQYQVSTAVQTYCPHGQFDPERLVDRLRELYRQSIAAGFCGARISGEMSWALRGIPGSERLIAYESMLNKMVTDEPLTMICQFDTSKFDGATIFEILNVHPAMIVRGQVINNPYYVPPEEYLKNHVH